MNQILIEVAAILGLVSLNGVLALSEIAVVSARRPIIEKMAAKRRRGAGTALRLMDTPGRFLSTVQVGITLVGILAGTFGGATIAEHIADRLAEVPGLAPFSEATGVIIVVLVITYLSVVFGELIPKRVALANPERAAVVISGAMYRLSRLAAPAVWLLDRSTSLIIQLMPFLPERATTPEEEVSAVVEAGMRTGYFSPSENAMIQGALRLPDRTLGTLMTRRPEVTVVSQSTTTEEFAEIHARDPRSRYPVMGAGGDQVVGILESHRLLGEFLHGGDAKLAAATTPPLFVPSLMTAMDMVEQFKSTGQQMAIVVDEYGCFLGIVTPKDLLRAFFGEVVAGKDKEKPTVVFRHDGTALVDGALPVDEFADHFDIDQRQFEGTRVTTIAGVLLAMFGRIPSPGDQLVAFGLTFEIVDLDGHRIDKILVTPTGS